MRISLDTMFVVIVASMVIGSLILYALQNGKEIYIRWKYSKHLEKERKEKAKYDFKLGSKQKKELDDERN